MLVQIVSFIVFFCIALLPFDFSIRFLLSQKLSLILAGGFFLSLCVGSFLPKHKVIKLLLMISLSAVAVLFLYKNNLTAVFGPVDDHEIITYLGSDRSMTLPEALGAFPASAMEESRFRPVNYLLKLVETALWDNNPSYWYAARLVFFIAFLTAVWYLSHKWILFHEGYILMMFIATSAYWADVWARIGPSESYVTLGMSMMAASLPTILKNGKKVSAWIILSLGYLIAIGSKENAIILALPLLGLIILKLKDIRSSRGVSAIVSALLALSCGTALSIWHVVADTNTDFYGQSTTMSSRASLLLDGIRIHESLTALLALAGSLFLLSIPWIRKNVPLRRNVAISALLFIGALITLLSQYVFYNGVWPTQSRYDVPGILTIPIIAVISLVLFRQLSAHFALPWSIRGGLISGLTLGMLTLIAMRGIIPIQIAVADNIQKTHFFQDNLSEMKKLSAENRLFVLESRSVWDHEIIMSYLKYSRVYRIQGQLAINFKNQTTIGEGEPSFMYLIQELDKIASAGRDKEFAPLSAADPSSCISVPLISAKGNSYYCDSSIHETLVSLSASPF